MSIEGKLNMKNSGIKFLIILLFIVAIIAGVLLALKMVPNQQTSSENVEEEIPQKIEEPVKTEKAFLVGKGQ